MEIGIIGLAQSGKTTVFNALTRGHVKVVAATQGSKPNIGVAKVPDVRLERLAALFKPRKVTPAEVTYVDIPGAPEGLGKHTGIGGEFLNRLQRVDALLLVVRAFTDPSVPHIEGTVDPLRDLETMTMELHFSDLGILERRLKRLEGEQKASKPEAREAAARERALLERVQAGLGKNVPLRAQTLTPDEAKALEAYQFLTAKPLIIALNIDEAQLAQAAKLETEFATRLAGPGLRGVAICGKLEAELGQMEAEEERAFRESLGAGESGLVRMVRVSYEVLGLISFFTVGEDEVRAWTVAKDSPAVKAAGKIHSDIERGFIRAEVVTYDDLIACGGLAEARKRGVLRLEGKTYPVKDGDIAHFLFSV